MTTLTQHADALVTALATLDLTVAAREAEAIAEAILRGSSPDLAVTKRVLGALRGKRQFVAMERVASAMMAGGDEPAVVRRQYAQALIEQGRLPAAEHVLRSILVDFGTDRRESDEARGLLGRIHKQRYLSGGAIGEARAAHLRRAIEAYRGPYERDRVGNYWHGINYVALTARAARDGVQLADGAESPRAAAEGLLAALDAADVEASTRGEIPVWQLATRVEALVALERWDDALGAAARYVAHPGGDAFEFGSTARQLREVWRLDGSDRPAARMILELLDGRTLRSEGGSVTLPPRALQAVRPSLQAFEATFGDDRMQSLRWYRDGLEAAKSVVRIDGRSGRPQGSGWLVEGGTLRDDWRGRRLVVTNKHVVSPASGGGPVPLGDGRWSLLPEDAVVRQDDDAERIEFDASSVVWSSPDYEMDTTLLDLGRGLAGARPAPCKFWTPDVDSPRPAARLYLIGHPEGRELHVSLNDNAFLAADARRIHYRTPTLGGTSGSPVFDDAWRVVATHHAGGSDVRRIGGNDAYAANEGILVSALRAAVRQP